MNGTCAQCLEPRYAVQHTTSVDMGANQMYGRVGPEVQLQVRERASRRLLHFYTIVFWSAVLGRSGHPITNISNRLPVIGCSHIWRGCSTDKCCTQGSLLYGSRTAPSGHSSCSQRCHESINCEAGQEIKRTRSQSSTLLCGLLHPLRYKENSGSD